MPTDFSFDFIDLSMNHSILHTICSVNFTKVYRGNKNSESCYIGYMWFWERHWAISYILVSRGNMTSETTTKKKIDIFTFTISHMLLKSIKLTQMICILIIVMWEGAKAIIFIIEWHKTNWNILANILYNIYYIDVFIFIIYIIL